MKGETSWSAGELAAHAGVSIRTLHHYDEIGILRPSGRTAAGYRQYGPSDVERLHRILVYRELGFDLATIAQLLDDPTVDPVEQLREQRVMLESEIKRLQQMVNGVEAMMNAKKTGLNLMPDEVKEVFGAFNPAEHAEEAEARWGSTDAYQESRRRSLSYDKQQWIEIRAEAERITADLAAAMRAGVPATSERAMDLAEQHRQHISRWFYDCGYAMHRGLADMYVADPRFAASYDDVEQGLSGYVRDAIVGNVERQG